MQSITTMACRQCYGYFNETIKATIAMCQFRNVINASNKNIELQIWDTAGQEQFVSLIPIYS